MQTIWVRCCLLGLAAAMAHAEQLSPEMLQLARQYGGVFSPDCANYKGLRVKFLGDSVVVERNGKSVTGTHVRALRGAQAFPNGQAPRDFKVKLLSDVSRAGPLSVVLVHNSNGLFATVAADPRVLAGVGPDIAGVTVRACDPNRNALPGAPPQVILDANLMLRDPRFKRLYVAALGPMAGVRWLQTLNGPAPEVKTIRIAGQDFLVVMACKQHECDTSNFLLLYSAQRAQLYGKLLNDSRPMILGSPSPALAAQIEHLWRKEWRNN